MRLNPPPHYANIPSSLLFDLDLPDPIFRTAAILHALAWRSKGEMTPPATVLELASLRGLKERRMYDHLRQLKDAGLIRVENLGDGRIVIHPLRWVGDAGAALSVSDLTQADLEELCQSTAKDCSSTAKFPNYVVVDVVDQSAQDQQQQHSLNPVTAKLCSSTAKDCSNEAVERLTAFGIIESVAGELAVSCTLEQIEGWIAYAQQATGLNDQAAFVVSELRRGTKPPKMISDEEKRAQRYTGGKYAHLIEH